MEITIYAAGIADAMGGVVRCDCEIDGERMTYATAPGSGDTAIQAVWDAFIASGIQPTPYQDQGVEK